MLATNGRGVWTYRFSTAVKEYAEPRPDPVPPLTGTPVRPTYTFATGAEGWTAATDDLLGRGWKASTEGSDGSPGSLAFDQYSDMTTATVTSPAITHPGGSAAVSFRYRINTEPGYDPVKVQWSSDATTWNTVATLNGLNANNPGYDARTVPFTVPAGKVFLRFALVSDDNGSWPLYDGVAVDDVTLLR